MLSLLPALLGVALAQQTELSLASLRDVSLPDQYGAEDCLRAHEGRPVVVFVVSAERLRGLRPWEETLRERFGERVDYLRIADVATDGATTRERVAEKLRERVPEAVSIQIDLDRRWSAELGLATDLPNLLIVDARGRLVAQYRGRRDPVLAELVAQRLESLLEAS